MDERAEERQQQGAALVQGGYAAEAEKQRYQQLFELAPDGYLVTNLDGTISMANRVASIMLGIESRYLIGKPLAVYIDPTQHPFFMRQLNRLQTFGTLERWQTRLRPRHHAELDVMIAVVRSFSPLAQDPAELLWQLQDMTEYKLWEQAERERTFRATFEQAPIAIGHLGPKGQWLNANTRLCEMFGYTVEEFKQLSWIDRNLPEDVDWSLEVFKRLAAGEQETFQREKRYLDRKGKIIWALVNVTAVHSPAGEFLYHIVVMENITERKRAEEALRTSEEKYRTLFSAIDEGFCIIERVESEAGAPLDFRYLEANLAFTANSGMSDVVGKTIRQAFPGEPEEWFVIYNTILITGKPLRFERDLVTAGRTLELYAFRIEDETHRQVGVIFKDITERKRIDAAEREQRLIAEGLRDTALALTSSLEFAEVIDHILLNIGRVVPHDASSFLLIEDESAYVVRARGYGQFAASLEAELQDFHISAHESDRIDEMLRTKSHVLIPRWEDHGSWDQVQGMESMRALVAVPILNRSSVIGYLKLYSRTPDFFTEEHATLLQVFAAQAAIAIQNARAYKEGQSNAVLNERHRLARELHDAVTQSLFSANVIADSLPRLWTEIPEPVQIQLQGLQVLTRGALAEMRTLLLELRPEYLANIDLEAQLRQLLDALQARKLITVNTTIQVECLLPSPVRIAFYRIAQEALNNIVKHAHATEIQMVLSVRPDSAQLMVQDNGVGFDGKGKHVGFGLHTMSERADEIGAELEIVALPQSGTLIRVTWGSATEA